MAETASARELWGLGEGGGTLRPHQQGFLGKIFSPLRKFFCSKTPLDWVKIGLNSAKKKITLISLRTPPKS